MTQTQTIDLHVTITTDAVGWAAHPVIQAALLDGHVVIEFADIDSDYPLSDCDSGDPAPAACDSYDPE